jgi:hypothetical protein
MTIEKDLSKIDSFRIKASKYLKEKAILTDVEIKEPIFTYSEAVGGLRMGIKTEWGQKINKEVLSVLTDIWDSTY